MNMKSHIIAAILALGLAETVFGQSSVFTYQGSLYVNGAQAGGVYDLQFSLFDAASAGNKIAGPVTNSAVTVTAGLFTVQIDFGSAAFPGASRWLEIGVRNNGAATNFTTLAPRQALTATPYSLQAANVRDGTVTANKLSPGPGTNGQVLTMSGGVLGWGSAGSVTYLATGPGILGGPITNIGAVSIDTTIIPRLNKANTFNDSNYFGGMVVMANSSNSIVGSFVGNGAGLSNITSSATNALAGDVTGASGANTVARIRGVSVATQAPAANQMLRYNGTAWTPGAVALGTDVSGILGVVAGGTGGSTAAAARTGLGAAASGANSDITSLAALTTPLSVAQGGNGQGTYAVGDILYASAPTILSRLADAATGNALVSGGASVAPVWGKVGLTTHVTGVLPTANGGSGQSTYAAGDILYASGPGTLLRLPVGATNQVLTVSSSSTLPIWSPATNGNHFNQAWSGIAPSDGLSVKNSATNDGASALTGIGTATGNLGYGVFGQTASTNGTGVQGLAVDTSGNGIGVQGESDSTTGFGVIGLCPAVTGITIGVEGEVDSTGGIGVYGVATATNGTPIGVYGESDAQTGYGLYTPNRLYVGDAAFFAGNIGIAATKRLFIDSGTSNAPGLCINGNTNCGMFSPGTNIISISTSSNERLRIAADGKVGIGRIALVNALELAGDASKATAGSWNANSDRRIKTEVRDLDNPLATLDRLHPVSFHYTAQYRHDHPEIEDKTYYNVVAQEFAEVFPESVKNSGEMLDDKPILQVDSYPAMIYSIAAIQELHARLKSRESELDRLRRQNEALEARLSALESRLAAPAKTSARQATELDAP